MTRDAFTCQICKNDKNTLNVHHRHYIKGREPWDYPDQLLVTLCESCHKKEEEASSNAQDMLNTMHHWGIFNIQIVDLFNKMIEEKLSQNIPYAKQNVEGLDSK